MKFLPRVASRPVVWLSILLLWCAAASAQNAAQPAVKMDVDSPFAHTSKPLSLQVRLGRWFPVAVTLSNTGEPLKGRLSLEMSSTAGNDNGNRHSMTVYSDVELPTTARKRIWLYGRADIDEMDAATVTFAARGIKNLTTNFTVQPRDPGSRIVLTVSDSEERLAFLNAFNDKRLSLSAEVDENMPPLNGSNGRQGWLRPLGATHDLVPDRWTGLEAADLLVLHDFPHSALSPEQLAAIKGYVAGGGALLVLAGQDWQRLAQSGLAGLWPVRPESSGAATAAETQELVQRYLPGGAADGADRLGGSPAVLGRGALRPDSRRLAGLGQTVLLAERDWGAGQVIWSAMDPTKPPFVGWRGQENLWIELLGLTQLPTRLESVNATELNIDYSGSRGYPYNNNANRVDTTARLVQVIQSLPQLKMPSTSVIAWFLALYVFVLVPVNYFVLRMMDKREWAWVTVPVIAIVFSVASYMAARSIKGTELLARHINIVQGTSTANLARADAMLWMLTPRRANYNVSSNNAQMTLSDYYTASDGQEGPGTGGQVTIREPDAGKSFRIEDFNVPMWEEAQFVGQGIVDLGKNVQVSGGPSGLTVTNGTPFDMRGVVIVDGARVFVCGKDGELRKNSSGPVARSGAGGEAGPQLIARIETASKISQLFPITAGAKGDSTLRELADTALQTAVGANFGKNSTESWLIGWATTPVAPLTLEDEEPHVQNVSLFVLRLPNGVTAGLGQAKGISMAAVKTMASEKLGQNEQVWGRRYTYRCDFTQVSAPIADVDIVVKGRVTADYYDYSDSAPGKLAKLIKEGKAARIEIYNTATGQWQIVSSKWSGAGTNGANWTLEASVNATLLANTLRRPDNVLQMRVHTNSGTLNVVGVTVGKSN